MNTSTLDSTIALDALRSSLRGRLITRDDAEYDQARAVFYGGIDARPLAIARVAGAQDVASVIAAARESGLPLAVRSGGHSGAGHSTVDGGLVIDLRDLREIDLDAESRTAWLGAGLTAGEVTTALAEQGLGIGFGDTGSVGIGGLTVGGGVGYLARKHGLTIDSLLAAEVVTADGQLLLASDEENPDLFWAIRGGGGNFGVATRFRFRLHDVSSVVGGFLVLPASADTITRFVAAAEAAPDELSTIANVMPAPPLPFLPEEVVGRVVIFAMLVHLGDEAAGQRALEPFRAIAEPLADLTRPMAYPEIYPPEDDSYHPTAVSRTMFVDRIDLPAAETIVRFLNDSDATVRAAQIRPLGGAVARVPADATAYAHRKSPIMVNLAAFYEGEADRIARAAWLADFEAALPNREAGAYVNFLLDEGEDRIRAAYPDETWARLARIKRRYDPGNLFRRNQNIPPADVASGDTA